MWSRRFLWVGLASAVGIAAATLALIWLAIFVLSGSREPNFTIANVTKHALIGIITYPVCWYLLVFWPRTYTRVRTYLLVALTYVMSCAIVTSVFAALAAQRLNDPLYGVGIVVLGMMILTVPYAAIATPMAFLHRRLLMRALHLSDPVP